MAAKLTFEAKMQGMEQVLEMLKAAEGRMNDFGRTGSYSLEGISSRFKEFSQSLETLNSSNKGLGGLIGQFDAVNRKAGDYLNKNYKGIVDAMKYEVRAMQSEIDKVFRSTDDAERKLEQLAQRRSQMSEDQYQQEHKELTREKNDLFARGVALKSEQSEIRSAAFKATPVPGAFGVASALGNPGMGTLGALMGMLPYLGPAVMGGMIGVGGSMVRQGYTKDFDTALSSQRLNLDAARAAQGGHPAVNMLRSLGLGLETNAGQSSGQKLLETGLWAQQSILGQALKGAAGGFIGGSFIPGLGNIGGAIIGGIGGALYGAANEKSQLQIHNEQMEALRARDKEAAFFIDKGGDRFMQEGDRLEASQRMFGMGAVHHGVMHAAFNGVGQERYMQFAENMQRYGLDAGGQPARFINRNTTYGFSPNQQIQMARTMGVTGASLQETQQGIFNQYAAAGLGGRDAFAARAPYGEFAANLESQRGAGVGAAGSFAASVGASSPGFNPVESVKQGEINYNANQNLLQGGSSALDTMMTSKLRQLGVTNAVAIAGFIKMDLTLDSTQRAIARYTGKSIDEVSKALGNASDAYKSMVNKTIGAGIKGPGGMTFGEAAGRVNDKGEFHEGDLGTLFLSGTQAFDNTSLGGATTFKSQKEMLAHPNKEAVVESGETTLTDIKNAGEAQEQSATELALDKMLSKTGQSVTEAMVSAIQKGWAVGADEIRKAGQNLINTRGQNAPAPQTQTFDGSKKNGPK